MPLILWPTVNPCNMLVPLVSTEHLDYDYQNNSCDEEKMCGHYTQVGHTNTVCARALSSWLSFHCVCLCAADGVGWHTQSGLCRPSVQRNGRPGLGEDLLPGLQLLPSVSTTAAAAAAPLLHLHRHHCITACMQDSTVADTASSCTAPWWTLWFLLSWGLWVNDVFI